MIEADSDVGHAGQSGVYGSGKSISTPASILGNTMPSFASIIKKGAAETAQTLSQEPEIRVDLSRASPKRIAQVIMYAIYKKKNTKALIADYLSRRGATITLDMLDFVIDSLAGGDQRHHLWQINAMGEYSLIDKPQLYAFIR